MYIDKQRTDYRQGSFLIEEIMAKQAKSPKDKSKQPSMRDLATAKPTTKRKRRQRTRSLRASGPFKRMTALLGKLVPKYFHGAWQEIRLTTWPGRRETIRLTIAVFIFSAVFAVIVAALDFVLDKIFKTLITG